MDATNAYYRGEARSHGIDGLDRETSPAHFRRYVDFVRRYLSDSARVLDLGCGAGWSSWMLAEAGLQVYGGDIHSRFFEAGLKHHRLQFLSCDVEYLPFPDSSLDGVAAHQFLEHVQHPEIVLAECLRVLRPEGRIIIVGPNLLSVGIALRGTAWQLSRILRGRYARRTPEMPFHPYGNTLSENWAALLKCSFHTARKLAGTRPIDYLMREPDLRPPSYADNDASYLCNPLDLWAWAKQNNMRVLANGAPHWRLSSVLWPVLGGTWVALEKPRL